MEILPGVLRSEWKYVLFTKQPLQLLSFNSSLLRIQPLSFVPGRIAAAEPCQVRMVKYCVRGNNFNSPEYERSTDSSAYNGILTLIKLSKIVLLSYFL